MEFQDADAAASAVRNLNEHEINGRKLRVDWSNEGSGASTNESSNRPQQTAQQTASQIPAGVDLPPNLSCPDAISRTLSTLRSDQLLDIISQMKGLVNSDPAKATDLLSQAPQLAYAIFQALLLLGLVDTSVLASVVSQAQPQQPQQPPQQPQQQQWQQQPQQPPQMPPQQMPPQQMPMQQHVPPAQYPGQFMGQYQQQNTMTPPTQGQFPPPQVGGANPQEREALKQRVMSLTQQQLDGLDPQTRNHIIMLRQSIMSGQI